MGALVLFAIVVVAAGFALMKRGPQQSRAGLADPATPRDALALEGTLAGAEVATTVPPSVGPQTDILGNPIPSYEPGGALDVNLVPGPTTLEVMAPKGGALDLSGPQYVPGSLDVGLGTSGYISNDTSTLRERLAVAAYKLTSDGTKKG